MMTDHWLAVWSDASIKEEEMKIRNITFEVRLKQFLTFSATSLVEVDDLGLFMGTHAKFINHKNYFKLSIYTSVFYALNIINRNIVT